jgi:hypothetical protein
MATVTAALLPDPDDPVDPAGAAEPAGAEVLEVDPVLLLDDELQAAARTATVPIAAAARNTPLARTLTSEVLTTIENPPPGGHFSDLRPATMAQKRCVRPLSHKRDININSPPTTSQLPMGEDL